jgi:hypothetical protein
MHFLTRLYGRWKFRLSFGISRISSYCPQGSFELGILAHRFLQVRFSCIILTRVFSIKGCFHGCLFLEHFNLFITNHIIGASAHWSMYVSCFTLKLWRSFNPNNLCFFSSFISFFLLRLRRHLTIHKELGQFSLWILRSFSIKDL